MQTGKGLAIGRGAAAGNMATYQVGEVLGGKYEIKAILGAGGMGTVYRARQLDLGRDVAIKVPLTEALEIPGFLARFTREAKTVAKLVHDNIVQVYEFVHSDADCYIVMEYMEGTDLKHMAGHPPPGLKVSDMATILRSACEGLSHAHEYGIVHRDIKPHNIMVENRGRGKWRVKIMDFGIAHLEANANITQNQEQLTVTGQAIGTPSYMSPEQIRGSQVSGQSDIYSMGCVVYFMFTRQTPFMGTGFTVAAAHLSEPAPSIRRRVPQLPEQLEEIIGRCLAKDPASRPADASDLGNEIYEALRPMFDEPMEGIWPDPKADGGGTDLIRPTVPIESGNKTVAAGGATVGARTLTGDDVSGTSAPTLAGGPAAPSGPPSRASAVSRSAAIPAQAPSSQVTRTGTVVPASTVEPTMAYGPGPEAMSMPSTTAELPEAPVPSRGMSPMMLGGLALIPLLAIGVGLGVYLGGGNGADPTPDPDPIPNNGGGIPNGGGEVIPDPGNGGVVLPGPTHSPAPLATPEPDPTRPVEATSAVPPSPTVEPTATPDPVLAAIKRAQTDFESAAADDIERRASAFVSAWYHSSLQDPRLTAAALELALDMALSPPMVTLESGRYTIGSQENVGLPEERPVHTVALPTFSIGRYEVTAIEFSAYLNSMDRTEAKRRYSTGSGTVVFDEQRGFFAPVKGKELHPANFVDWQLAKDYTVWLAEKTGVPFRLPSEAEWEVAARTNAGYTYPWGDLAPDQSRANFDRLNGDLVPVFTLPAGRNSYGLHHMAGNVQEWCLDWYHEDAYQTSERDQRANPVRGEPPKNETRPRRVARGGGVEDTPDLLRSASRGRLPAETRKVFTGFRLVREHR